MFEGFTRRAARVAVAGGLAAALMAAAMEKRGFKLISIAPTDYPSSFYLTRPEAVKTMEDLKGLKIRIAGGRIGQLAGEVYGYSPVAIAGAELVPALTQGVVDGGILPPIYSHDNKLPLKGLTVTPFAWPAVTPIIMSLAEFNSLTPEQQQLMMETGSELAARALKTVEENATASVEALKAAGATVVVLGADDIPAWRDKAATVWEAFVKENGEDAQTMLDEAIALRGN